MTRIGASANSTQTQPKLNETVVTTPTGEHRTHFGWGPCCSTLLVFARGEGEGQEGSSEELGNAILSDLSSLCCADPGQSKSDRGCQRPKSEDTAWGTG